MPKPERNLLPTAEEAVSLERAARCEIIRRKLQKLQSRDEKPRTDKQGVEYLLECFHRDGVHLRAYQRQEGESAKAFSCFEIYRDLGAGRSLAKAAELFYGKDTGNLRQVEEWSSKHDWVDRAGHFDDWHTMLERSAVERYLQERAEDMGRREVALREKALSVREKALAQAERMLEFPLLEQKVLDTDEDGTARTLIFVPARWNKATARTLYDLAVGNGEPPEEPDLADYLDFSSMTEDEVRAFYDLYLKAAHPDRPHGSGGGS